SRRAERGRVGAPGRVFRGVRVSSPRKMRDARLAHAEHGAQRRRAGGDDRMNMREEVVLSRNAEGVMIPSGEHVLIPQGAHATITQSLGGSYTLITDRGLMVRVSGREVEAIGKTAENVADVKEGEELTPEKLEELVWDQLKTCYDPEIPVNIVDLGLVYLCELQDADGGGKN